MHGHQFLPRFGVTRALLGTAILFVAGAAVQAPAAGAPGHDRTEDRLQACLSTPEGRTAAGFNACLGAAYPNDRFMKCMDRAVSNWDSNQCIHGEMDRTWIRMERVYAQLLRRLPPAQAQALRREQKTWASGREKRCAHGEMLGDDLMCLADQNEHRIAQLRRRLRSLPPRGRQH